MIIARKLCAATALCVLLLSGCDPLYRFKFTRFYPVSETLRGRETKIVQIKDETPRTIRVERDGIIVKPIGGMNNSNHITMDVSVANNTDSALSLNPSDVRMLFTNSPADGISNTSRGRAVKAVDVTMVPSERADRKFVIGPKGTAELHADFGILLKTKYILELTLTREDTNRAYVYRFKGVSGGY